MPSRNARRQAAIWPFQMRQRASANAGDHVNPCDCASPRGRPVRTASTKAGSCTVAMCAQAALASKGTARNSRNCSAIARPTTVRCFVVEFVDAASVQYASFQTVITLLVPAHLPFSWPRHFAART